MSVSKKSVSQGDDLENSQELLRKLRKEYETADELIKEVQSFTRKAGIPAINELRYMGHHLLLSSGDGTDPEDELRKAIGHCQRAAYEAAEAGTLAVLDEVDIFRRDYKSVVVTDVVGDYLAILKHADQCQVELRKARQEGHDRDVDYARLMDAFRSVKGHCTTLNYAREELNKKIISRPHGFEEMDCRLLCCGRRPGGHCLGCDCSRVTSAMRLQCRDIQ